MLPTFVLSFIDGTSQINTSDSDVKLNEANSQQNSSSQKYSQILGDHHTNHSSQLSNGSKNTLSHSSVNHNYRTRSYNNNKENYYNQRSAVKNTSAQAATKNSWQRSNNNNSSSSNNIRTNSTNYFDGKKLEENGNSGVNGVKNENDTTEPLKFNEGKLERHELNFF
jgi:hypothetical protein